MSALPVPESGYRLWVNVDSHGTLVGGVQLSAAPVPGWRPLSRDEERRCQSNLRRWRYPLDGSPAVELPEVRLLVGSPRFVAGAERGSVQVQGVPAGEDGAWVRVNGQRRLLAPDEVYLLSSDEPASWSILLDDPRYWTRAPQHVVQAVAEEAPGDGAA